VFRVSRLLVASVVAGVVLVGPIATATAQAASAGHRHGQDHSRSHAASRTRHTASGDRSPSADGGTKTHTKRQHDSKRQHNSKHQHDSKREHQHHVNKHTKKAHHAPAGKTPATRRPATTTAARRTVRATGVQTASAIEARLATRSPLAQPTAASVRYAGVVAVPGPVTRPSVTRPSVAHRAAGRTIRRDVQLLANRFEQAPLPGKLVMMLAAALAMVMIFVGSSIGRRGSA